MSRSLKVQHRISNPNVLVLGFDVPLDHAPQLCRLPSGGEAIERMRMSRFEWLVTAPRLPDMAIWDLLHAVRTAWPWQKWALVADESIGAAEEIRARELGVSRLFDAMPTVDELLALVHRPATRSAMSSSRTSSGPITPSARAT